MKNGKLQEGEVQRVCYQTLTIANHYIVSFTFSLTPISLPPTPPPHTHTHTQGHPSYEAPHGGQQTGPGSIIESSTLPTHVPETSGASTPPMTTPTVSVTPSLPRNFRSSEWVVISGEGGGGRDEPLPSLFSLPPIPPSPPSSPPSRSLSFPSPLLLYPLTQTTILPLAMQCFGCVLSCAELVGVRPPKHSPHCCIQAEDSEAD